MNIAVIGAGNVGSTLGAAWAKKAGHHVFFGVRSPDAQKTQALLAGLNGKARAGTANEAAAVGDVIVLATPWPATEAAIRSMGNLAGKIVIDATNPLTMGADGLGLAIGFNTSGGEQVQAWAAGASVFKALNTTGFNNMANPVFRGTKAVMFIAGDDAAKKPAVIDLVGQLGFEPVDAGPLRNARLLEAHAMLWIDLALNRNVGRDWAFAIVRR